MLDRYEGESQYYNKADHVWRYPNGRRIELGYLDNEKDVYQYQGAEYDGFFPDELTQFPRDWYLYIFGSIRSTRLGQRQRVLATSNPGGDYEAWVKERWGPWLDDKHPRPAKSGEIRWYHALTDTLADYAEEEIPEDHPDVGTPLAWSRTFIKALVADNPHVGLEYQRIFAMIPGVLRKQWEFGDWNIGTRDSEWQVIPTEWIRLAQERWTQRKRPDVPMSQLGIDVARGGKDFTVKVPRYETWFSEPIKHPGADTPDGNVIADQVEALETIGHPLTTDVPIGIDIIGVGSSPADILKKKGYNVVALDARLGSEKKTQGGLRFANKRAEWWWGMREALDPKTGEDYALPPGSEVLGDLSSARWRPTARGVQIEEKDDIKKRIGRSPDVGETIIYAQAQPSPKSKVWIA